MSSEYIVFFDTTLRDGEQSPGFSMNLAEKLRMAEALADLGVDVMEAGFPIASQGDFEAVQEIARRAEAIKAYLVGQGVSAARISTISYGKEQPVDLGTGEDAWAHNRNGHTALTGGVK